MTACVSTKPAETTFCFLLMAIAVSTVPARQSGLAFATSSNHALLGAKVCEPSTGIASGFSGDSFAISSAARSARVKLASSNCAVVTVPERLPKLEVIASVTPDDAPAVVTELRAKRTLPRSLPLTTSSVSSALLIERARSVSCLA
jgi:hypothetical protein